jgi:type II secretory pathway component PulF
MKSYQYIARDATGARREGYSQALSSSDVLSWLRDNGFTPVSVNEIAAAAKKTKTKARRGRIKSADLAALCWQLTTMVEGGIPITSAIETIADDIESSQLQSVLNQVLDKMQKGETFSDSISGFPHVFNQLSRAIILAGETGGSLPTALRRVAEYFDNRDKLAKKLKGAMAYPIFVITFIILIVIFIMAFIIPRFKTIFDQFGGELPAFTRGFMGVYDLLRFNLFYIVGFVALTIFAAITTYTRTQKGNYFFRRLALSMPLFSKLIAQTFIAIFCKTMATLLGSGVSVLEAFGILSSMARNDIIRDAIDRARESIVGGCNIHTGMSQAGFFPNMVVKMVQVGEESGSLTRVLERTADYYERKVDATITTLMGLLEPVMIVTVGAIVLMVVLALYLPIFTMSDVKG